MGKVIALVNQKGGVGKTTTTVNLAACVAQEGHKVLIIDMDPQCNATRSINRDNEDNDLTMYDVLLEGVSIKKIISSTLLDGLSIAPSSIDLVGFEVKMIDHEERENIFKAAINDVRKDYDYIFIDSPPSLGLLTINILTAANDIIVPVQCEYFAIEGFGQLLQTIKLIREKRNKQLDIGGIVLTMYDPRTRLSNQVVEEVKKHFGDKVFGALISKNIRLAEAPSFGKPIIKYDPECSGAKNYTLLAKEFIKRCHL